MSDVLSQQEIDELLKAVNTGEVDVEMIQSSTSERKIIDYDFKRPNKFANEHLRTLDNIYEDYSRHITNFLTAYLRTLVNIEVVSVEETTYYEFSNSIVNPSVLSIVDFSPLSGFIVFEINPNISFVLIDRILGGKGYSMDRVRNLTEIELSIIEKLMSQMLNLMKEPWGNVLELRPKLDRIETNSQFIQFISPNEMIALITLNVKIGDVEGFMNICIPHLVVEPIISKLSTRYRFALTEKKDTTFSKESLEKNIEKTMIPIKVVLGSTNIVVLEFLQLQKGDVIQLDTEANSDLKVMVGNIHKFNAKPGVRKNRNAVMITNILRREEEAYE